MPSNTHTRAATASRGAAAALRPRREKCGNCQRAFEGTSRTIRENGYAYCRQNCYWSVTLDVNNSRLKKKRKGRGIRRRDRRRDRPEENPFSAAPTSPPRDATPPDVNNALFAMSALFGAQDWDS